MLEHTGACRNEASAVPGAWSLWGSTCVHRYANATKNANECLAAAKKCRESPISEDLPLCSLSPSAAAGAKAVAVVVVEAIVAAATVEAMAEATATVQRQQQCWQRLRRRQRSAVIHQPGQTFHCAISC